MILRNWGRVLFSLSLVILLLALGSFIGSENVRSGGLPNTTDSTPVSSENVTADNVTPSDILGMQLDVGNTSLNESASESILPTESLSLTPTPEPTPTETPTPIPKPIFAPLGNGPTGPVHNIDTHENFSTIQDAIYDSDTQPGHTITVDAGNYTENVKVNKSLTIRSTSGNPAVTIVQATNSNDHVFNVTVDWVNISGFTVKNATEFGMLAGINLNGVEHCNISDNSVTNNDIGIALIDSSGNTICNNLVDSNIWYGIYLELSNDNIVTDNIARFTEEFSGISLLNSGDNKITNNRAYSNFYGGIELLGSSSNNLIDNNTANSNDGLGIILMGPCNYNNITNNTANYQKYMGGIELWYECSYNTIKNNTANSNGGGGILLCYEPVYNTIENNTVIHNEYSGIELYNYANHNLIINNSASFNNVSGIALYHSSSDNTVSHNELSSNQFGLSIVQVADEYNPLNNQIENNTISYSKSHGIYLLDLKYTNNVTNNTVSNSNLYGILVENSSNNNIGNNTANQNERGIGLVESSAIEVINNTAKSNKISGFSLVYSDNNNISNNFAHCNTYEGIYLSNSSLNNITRNNISSSYFGISLYNSSNNNNITNNDASSNYYFGVFNDSSCIGNDIDVTPYSQMDNITGVRVYVSEALTPSLQSIDPSINATYYIMVENLGTKSDTFDLNYSSSNDQYAVSLDKNTISLGPGAISANTTLSEEELPPPFTRGVKMNVETIKLNVSGTEFGVCRVNVKAISKEDQNVSDSVETWTIVHGINKSSYDSTSIIIDSALIKNSNVTDYSTVNRSAIINSTISHSTITDSIITNSEVVDTPLPSGVILEDAIVKGGYITSGTITLNGTAYEITTGKEIKIADLVTKLDYRDSDLVGIQYAKTLDLYAVNSNVSFNISAKDDYFAGSMRVQTSDIPPNGIPEFTNNLSGYVYVNVSDNLVNSTGWLIIKVFYDKNELGDFDPSSLKLKYYNVSAAGWEDIPIGGLNQEENYVWGNISHYSVFSVSGSVTPKEVPPKLGIPGGSHAPLDDDADGLSNIQELIIGTDPNNPDTDGDGLKDGEDPFPLDPNLPMRLTPTPTPVLPPGVSTIPTDPTGLVTSSVTAYSADGKASVTIPAGTTAKDIAGNPLTEITITSPSALPAEVPSGVEYVGYALQIGPEGAIFSQPLEISIIFDPAQFEGKKPVLYVYEAGTWKPLETTIVGTKAIAYVDHFSIFVLFARQAAPTPTLTPTPRPFAFPIWAQFPAIPLVIVIEIVIIVIIGAVAYMVLRRK